MLHALPEINLTCNIIYLCTLLIFLRLWRRDRKHIADQMELLDQLTEQHREWNAKLKELSGD